MDDIENLEDLRATIWDYLFQERNAKSIDELATAAEMAPAVIRGAVQHHWFKVVDDKVSIAYSIYQTSGESKSHGMQLNHPSIKQS